MAVTSFWAKLPIPYCVNDDVNMSVRCRDGLKVTASYFAGKIDQAEMRDRLLKIWKLDLLYDG